MNEQATQGYDIPAVEAWIEANVASLQPPFDWQKLEGGHSNLTYRLTDANGKLAVIRRPPMGELLPKAHDMGREWQIISALGPTDVPVAAALGFCEGPEVTGAHFYVMGHVEGKALYTNVETEQWIAAVHRTNIGESFIDVLSALHSLDPDEIGLGNLGKKENYVGRQLNTWYRSWTASIEAAEYDDERVHEMQSYLAAHVPEQGPARVVHGDYGVHNCLFSREGEVAGVLDWEISTLGDPLADLAYALNQWILPGDVNPVKADAGSAVEGMLSREQLAERYAQNTGRDLAKLDYYIGFNWLKSAMIIHGVYARYKAGKKSTEGVDMIDLRARITRNIDEAERAISRVR